MFKEENYSISEYGYIDDIKKITSVSLYEHYKKIIGASVINIFVCGELNIHEIREEIEGKVKVISFDGAELKKSKIIKKESEKEDVREYTDLTQGKLSIGFRTNVSASDEDYWALMLANNVYGGALGSMLYNNVR